MNIAEINTMSISERINLVEAIWDSIAKDQIQLTDAQKAELDRRLDRIDNGETVFSTWDEVKARLNKRD